MPMWRWCTGVRDMSSPPSAMRPVWPVSRPATSFSSVDLPEPLGPITATSSPVRTSSDTSCRPCVLPG